MRDFYDKEFVRVRFGWKEIIVWAQWFFVSILLGIINFPFMMVVSGWKVIRHNPMFNVFWLTLIADLWLKQYFSMKLANGYNIEVISGFLTFTLVHNEGAAFGMMPGKGHFFVFIALLTGVFILFYLSVYRLEDRRTSWALVLILSGAVGNMVDRLNYGYVIDYILVYYQTYKFPVFNLADIVINIGVGLLILDWILELIQDSKTRKEG